MLFRRTQKQNLAASRLRSGWQAQKHQEQHGNQHGKT